MTGEVDPATVERRLGGTDDSNAGDDIDVVDIRDSEAYAEGHIPGAENLPPDELEAVVADRKWADEVVVVCYVGETSVQAARMVEHYADDSVDVASMTGGYEAWDGDLDDAPVDDR